MMLNVNMIVALYTATSIRPLLSTAPYSYHLIVPDAYVQLIYKFVTEEVYLTSLPLAIQARRNIQQST